VLDPNHEIPLALANAEAHDPQVVAPVGKEDVELARALEVRRERHRQQALLRRLR
jgi:hypothetical protein